MSTVAIINIIMTTTLMKETNEYHFMWEGYIEGHCGVLPFDLGIIGYSVLSVNQLKLT